MFGVEQRTMSCMRRLISPPSLRVQASSLREEDLLREELSLRAEGSLLWAEGSSLLWAEDSSMRAEKLLLRAEDSSLRAEANLCYQVGRNKSHWFRALND